MKQPQPPYYTLLGLLLWGDIGPYTAWRRHTKNTPVFTLKTPPKKPPSQAQKSQRLAFQTAMQKWNALTPAQKLDWQNAAKRLSLRMHGMNAFIHIRLTKDLELLTTLRRQTAIDLHYDP
jgi:hypothetical protein